ncbi:DUF2272 domain-containing protein [Candidatus Woesearchaeota archaeon]|nr:DUF2272 domain-containing protein [Candidatus Woesearchaeota archaeon]
MKRIVNRKGTVVADAIDIFVMVMLAFFAFMFLHLVLVKSTGGEAEIAQVKTTEHVHSVLYGVSKGLFSRELLGDIFPSLSDDLITIDIFERQRLSGEASILKRSTGGARITRVERELLGNNEEQQISEHSGGETPEVNTERSQPTEGVLISESLRKIAEEEWQTWEKGAKIETEMQEKVFSYYKAGGCYSPAIFVNEVPWSAAFISYVAREAYSGLPQSCAHMRYFNAVKNVPADTTTENIEKKCKTFPIEEAENIKVGDILCQCRGEECRLSYDSLPEFAPAHCDIVVEKDDSSLKVIGGNLGNSVKKVTVLLEKLKNPPYFGFITCEGT